MKYLKKINSHPVTFIALVVVQAYGHHQSKKKYRKSWVSFKKWTQNSCSQGSGNQQRWTEGGRSECGNRAYCPMMSWCSCVKQVRMQGAKALSSLTVIWDDTCLRTPHDPTVEEWRPRKKGGGGGAKVQEQSWEAKLNRQIHVTSWSSQGGGVGVKYGKTMPFHSDTNSCKEREFKVFISHNKTEVTAEMHNQATAAITGSTITE